MDTEKTSSKFCLSEIYYWHYCIQSVLSLSNWLVCVFPPEPIWLRMLFTLFCSSGKEEKIKYEFICPKMQSKKKMSIWFIVSTNWNLWGHKISCKSWKWKKKKKPKTKWVIQLETPEVNKLKRLFYDNGCGFFFLTNTNLCLAWHWSHCCLYHEGSRFYAAARWLLKLKVIHEQTMFNKYKLCIKSF